MTLRSLDVSEVSAMYIILFIDTSDMLFDFCIAVLGMERGALLYTERRAARVSFESIFVICCPLSAVCTARETGDKRVQLPSRSSAWSRYNW